MGVLTITLLHFYPVVVADDENELLFESYTSLVKEFDSRRRLQFLFPNPQTLFDGLNIGFVQTTKGNLTFQRRDIVVLDIENVIAARVHDSASDRNYGFGPRWRLSIAETIDVEGNSAIHTDSSGARHEFSRSSSAIYEPKRDSPATSGRTIGIIGDHAVIRMPDGRISQFKRNGSSTTFILVRRVTPSGVSISHTHELGKIRGVFVNERLALQFSWSGDRIRSVEDTHGRMVEFEYDDSGLLTHVTDIAGQVWSYGYDEQQRLMSATYPDGTVYWTLEYDHLGRVTRSNGAREFLFRYFADRTNVSEPGVMTHVFNFNKNGAVVAYETDQGHEWRLALDSKNRVVELNRNRESYGLTYLNDRLRSIRHSLGVWEFEYDDRGRILSGEGTPPLNHANPKIDYPSDHSIVVQMDDRDIAYELNESNNVTRIRQNDKEHELSYDWRGLLTEISFDGRSMRMQRNQLGRIVSTNYPDNRTATYYYDALGNRNLTKFGTGGRMALEHDGRGNIIGVVDTSASGTRVMQTYEIDEKNRVSAVTLPGPTLIKVNYDSTGRPTHLKLNDKHVYVEYDEAEIATLRADSRIWHVPRSGSSGAFEDSIVDHDILLHRDRSSPSQPDYGFVVFGNDLALDAKFRSIWHELVPGLNEARSITQVTRVWFDNSRSLSFEKTFQSCISTPRVRIDELLHLVSVCKSMRSVLHNLLWNERIYVQLLWINAV